MEIIITSIVFCIFANLIRAAEIFENTQVFTFKQYWNYNNYSLFKYNIIWFMVTIIIYILSKLPPL